jgi:POT family proton-dependent oligopeptide transporter
MAKSKYLTAPIPSKKMPAGIPYILSTEACERFAFYGMVSILVVFMTEYLLGPNGALNVMAERPAKEWLHWFNSAVYFLTVVGAIISDIWLGKFKTIIWFSMLYCVGFAILAWDHTRLGLVWGLVLIALASGIIKPSLSANVGDQFGSSSKHLIQKFYGWFYFSINLGAAFSMFICPVLLDKYGPTVGFGVPGIFMVIALLSYWIGRYKLVHIPPAGKTRWKEMLDKESLRTLARIGIIFLFVSMFFALFYQTEAAWVLQAKKMNLMWLGRKWHPAQMMSANPFLIMILIPLFTYVLYPAFNHLWTLTLLRKIGIGMFLTAASFLVPVWIETQLANGGRPSIGWQFVAYIFLTAAEVMVSITALEFAYTQGPKKMKSMIQSINLLSISLGNAFAAVVNRVIENEDGTSKLPGASYYWFFVIAMLVTAAIFIPVARWYKPKEYIQDEASGKSEDREIG